MAKIDKSNSFIKIVKEDSAVGFVFFMAFIGALVYFVQQSDGFGGFLLAIIKAVVWPALLVHHVLGQLNL